MLDFEIVNTQPDDWPAMREIFQQGLDSGLASFKRLAANRTNRLPAGRRSKTDRLPER